MVSAAPAATAPAGYHGLPARQQPEWPDPGMAAAVADRLRDEPSLVDEHEIETLASLLAEAARGRLKVLQAGDCAEDPADSTVDLVTRKAALLGDLADVLADRAGRPVLVAGRIAGQFGKPRSEAVERRDGVALPVFRGFLVNDPGFTASRRTPDPQRLIMCHRAASMTIDALRWLRAGADGVSPSQVWTSHEALVLDYEVPQLRRDDAGRLFLSSTHWPWIGDRTRQLDGAHVRLFAEIANPVACKVGPSMTVRELVELCEVLDPHRVPGRLTLIARLGAELVGDRLPGLVAAVHAAGHPVIWLCDPMHGNSERGPSGRKIRMVGSVIQEVIGFQQAVASAGGVAGGLHLEVTPEDVTECLVDRAELPMLAGVRPPLCDPRLNAAQAQLVMAVWQD